MWGSAEGVRLAERRFGPPEVTHAEPDLTDRVEPIGHWRNGVVRRQLVRGSPQLSFGALPCAAQCHDLSAVDPADAGKPRDRLTLAPSFGRLGPLACPPIVGQVATRGDHLTVRNPGGERRQLAVHGCDRRFLHDGEPIQRRSRGDLEGAEGRPGKGLKVGIGDTGADRDRLLPAQVRCRSPLRPWRRRCEPARGSLGRSSRPRLPEAARPVVPIPRRSTACP